MEPPISKGETRLGYVVIFRSMETNTSNHGQRGKNRRGGKDNEQEPRRPSTRAPAIWVSSVASESFTCRRNSSLSLIDHQYAWDRASQTPWVYLE